MKIFYSNDYKLDFDLKLLIQYLANLLSENQHYTKIKYHIYDYISNNLKTSNKKNIKLEEYKRLLSIWDNDLYPYLFMAALQLISLKSSICSDINCFVKNTESSEKPLSLKYDNITSTAIYMQRSITLRFIDSHIYKLYNSDDLFKKVINKLQSYNISVNSSYYPIITESLKQSTISKGGANYEDLIEKYLLDIGLNNIQRFNHDDVGSLENDFKFLYNGCKYGISAKKTLRERYKQYVNLIEKNTDIDIFLTITLGTDLTEEKAKIIQSFGVYIFVSPEIYNSYRYLQDINGIYNIFDLNLDLLVSLK